MCVGDKQGRGRERMAAMLRDNLGTDISNGMVTKVYQGPCPACGQDTHAPSSGVVLNEAMSRGHRTIRSDLRTHPQQVAEVIIKTGGEPAPAGPRNTELIGLTFQPTSS